MPQTINLVVFDADDTLWYGLDGGYIAGIDCQDEGSESYTFQTQNEFLIQREDGQRFQLFGEVPAALEKLHQRGILISLASYNHPGPTIRALQSFGILHYFQHMAIEFHGNKDRMLQNILRNFQQESFVVSPQTTLFIDDDTKGKYRQQMAAIGVNFLQRGTDILKLSEILEHPNYIFQPARKMYSA